MAIKTTITESPANKLPYPVLRKGKTGIVVLFTGPTTGVCLEDPNKNTLIGYIYTEWTSAVRTDIWEDCTITISNA